MDNISFYKANKTNTGSGLSASLGYNIKEKEDGKRFLDHTGVRFSIIAQYSWTDAQNGRRGVGSFRENESNPQKSINFNLDKTEVAKFIGIIDRVAAEFNINDTVTKERYSATFTHVYNGDTSSLFLACSLYKDIPYMRMSFKKVYKGGGAPAEVAISMNYDDMILLRQYFIFALNKSFEKSIELKDNGGYGGSNYANSANSRSNQRSEQSPAPKSNSRKSAQRNPAEIAAEEMASAIDPEDFGDVPATGQDDDDVPF